MSICGWGTTEQGSSILLLKSIDHSLKIMNTDHSNSQTNNLKVLKRIVIFFKDYKFVYKILSRWRNTLGGKKEVFQVDSWICCSNQCYLVPRFLARSGFRNQTQKVYMDPDPVGLKVFFLIGFNTFYLFYS